MTYSIFLYDNTWTSAAVLMDDYNRPCFLTTLRRSSLWCSSLLQRSAPQRVLPNQT